MRNLEVYLYQGHHKYSPLVISLVIFRLEDGATGLVGRNGADGVEIVGVNGTSSLMFE